MADNREARVAVLPRRVAHAVYALLVAEDELKMPAKASEIVIYDSEAPNAQSTGAALGRAQRLGLAVNAGGCWVATFDAHDLRYQLEERFLDETEDESFGYG